MTRANRETHVHVGGYSVPARWSTSGGPACDPCSHCGRRPQEGEPLLHVMNAWLLCGPCGQAEVDLERRLAAERR